MAKTVATVATVTAVTAVTTVTAVPVDTPAALIAMVRRVFLSSLGYPRRLGLEIHLQECLGPHLGIPVGISLDTYLAEDMPLGTCPDVCLGKHMPKARA
ncbi:hypothetical protein RugamoR1_29590 [Rugamonas sp. R1(2021)]